MIAKETVKVIDMALDDSPNPEKKNVFGNDLVYPICFQAKLLTALTGQKTLTQGAINTIKRLGYKLKQKEVTL